MATPVELLHDRIKALLVFLKPKLTVDGIDLDRLANLRRLSDVRIRKFAIEKPGFTALDLCGLLADPRVGRFDDVADASGILKKGHLSIVLPMLAEDMGYLIEACLTLQVVGLPAMKSYATAFVAKHGAVAAPAGPALGPAAKPAATPMPPGVAKLLAPMKDLWSLSPSTQKALSLLAIADSPPDAVCAEIERNPALSALALRFVNASTGTKASSVKRAVVSLGYPLTRRFLMTAALALKLGAPHPEAGFDERAFWRHSLQIAQAAAQVSKATRLGNPDEHYSAGLLHAIGRLAAAKAGGPSPGAPSAQVGAAILERWRFPAPVVEAARHHADTSEELEELQIPREAMVVTALRALAGTAPSAEEARAWAGFLRISADSIPAILDAAAVSAQAGVGEIFG
jgi:HD-like signal output (HDOD) protein